MLRRRIAASPISRGAAFPFRAALVARYDVRMIGRSLDWLFWGHETMNFSYDLDPLNRDQLSWFVAAITGAEIGQVRAWMQELDDDDGLSGHLTRRLSTNPRRGISEAHPYWARRLGWYALVRAVQPDHVVETGTDLGLGSCVIAAALLRNGHGRLTTIDTDPEAGYLIGKPWENVIDNRSGNSLDILGGVTDVDMFLHDSLHTYEHESAEIVAIEPNLATGAIVLSDNAHESPACAEFAERTGRHYLFFKELPFAHWWPGDGIGVAWKPESTTGTR